MQTQNDFYQFAKKNLRLREEIQSLTAGVDFLEELLETQALDFSMKLKKQAV